MVKILEHFYACTVCMAGYPSENAWVSEVKCDRNIKNKRNKTGKKKFFLEHLLYLVTHSENSGLKSLFPFQQSSMSWYSSGEHAAGLGSLFPF